MHYLIHSNTIFRRPQVATVIQLVSGEARVQSPSQTPQAHVFFFSALGLGCGTWDLVPRRDRTCAPCRGRWILNLWATREVPTAHVLNHDAFFTLWDGGGAGPRPSQSHRA